MPYDDRLVKVKVLADRKVAVMTLENPPLNLLDREMALEIPRTLHALDGDDAVRVIVLRGSGEKAFSAGADVSEFPQAREDASHSLLIEANKAVDAFEQVSKPVIAAMEGYVLGGGCEIALACDIRILGKTGRIGCPEINLGIFPIYGGLFRLAQCIGLSRAYEMLYIGDSIDADTALSYGLVSHVVPAGTAEDAAVQLAARIAEKPVEAVKMIKRGVRELLETASASRFSKNVAYSHAVFSTQDCAEGVEAFLKKRKPSFQK